MCGRSAPGAGSTSSGAAHKRANNGDNSRSRLAKAACLSLCAVTPVRAQGPGRGPGPGSSLAAPILPLPEEQATALRHMREEEKLARDVYQQLYEKWQLTVFKNIAASEETHFRAVGNLLERCSATAKHPGICFEIVLDASAQLLRRRCASGCKACTRCENGLVAQAYHRSVHWCNGPASNTLAWQRYPSVNTGRVPFDSPASSCPAARAVVPAAGAERCFQVQSRRFRGTGPANHSLAATVKLSLRRP